MSEMLKRVANAIDNLKLKDIAIYDFRGFSPLFDYMVIASATSERQVLAAINHIGQAVPEVNSKIEGASEGRWLLFDLGDIIVNVMHTEEREYYQLDKLFIQRNRILPEDL
jgi:ribosome-associated protein